MFKNFDEFVKTYDQDLTNLMVKKFGSLFDINDLADLKQDFYCHLLMKDALSIYDPERSKFSTFICTYLRYFLLAHYSKNRRCPLKHQLVLKKDQNVYSFLDLMDDPNAVTEQSILSSKFIETFKTNLNNMSSTFDVPAKIKAKEKESFLIRKIIHKSFSDEELREVLREKYAVYRRNPFKVKELAHGIWKKINNPAGVKREDLNFNNFLFAEEEAVDAAIERIRTVCPLIEKNGLLYFDWIKEEKVMSNLKSLVAECKVPLKVINGKLGIDINERAKQVLDMLLKGYKNVEIAEKLDITPGGVCSIRKDLKGQVSKILN